MNTVSNRIGKDVEYHGLIIAIVGIYLIYNVIKSAIQVGIRMFKLIILQIMAPLAIIAIISEGTGKTFKTYCSKLGKVFVEVFIRMLAMFIVLVFVCKLYINKSEIFGNLSASGGWANVLVAIVLVVAAFKFAGDIPKFISEVFPGFSAGDEKGGFGKFLGSLVGGTAGAIGGIAGGISAGAAAGLGLGGIAANALVGGVSGANAGIKGEKIADKVKNLSAESGKNYARAQDIAARGGLMNIVEGTALNAVGAGKRMDTQLGKFDTASKVLDAYDSGTAALLKQQGVKASATRVMGAGFTSEASNIKMKSKDEYKAEMLQYNTAYQNAMANYDRLKSDPHATEDQLSNAMNAVAEAKRNSDDSASDLYEQARQEIAQYDPHGRKLASDVEGVFSATKDKYGNAVQIERNDHGGIDVKKSQGNLDNAKYGVTDTKKYEITHPPGGNK